MLTWKENSAGPLHVVYSGYGIGGLIAQLATPTFLNSQLSGGVIPTDYNSSCRVNQSSPSISINQSSTQQLVSEYPANFVNAYWILASIAIFTSLTFLCYHIHGRITNIRIDQQRNKNYTKVLSIKESLSPRSCSPSKPTYAVLIVISMFFFYGISLPLNRGFTKFIFSYARDAPCLSVTEATTLTSFFFIGLCVGRVGGFLLSTLIHMKYLLQVSDLMYQQCRLARCSSIFKCST